MTGAREANVDFSEISSRQGPIPMLHEFLSTNRAAIIARTRAKVAARPAPRATAEELDTGIPLFLDQIISVLRLPSASSEAIGESAAAHGRNLLQRGFTIAQVVHDYGGVCQVVTELADEKKAPITAAEFQTFNRGLDDAIAQAVTEYAQQRERSITEEGMARSGEIAHELRNALGSAMLAFETITTGSVGPRGSTATLLGRSLRRLAELIDSSVAEVRLEGGLRSPERISVREFIEEVEVGASMEANARGFTLSVMPPPLGIDVNVDRQLLAAAVANLLQNAFKFTRPQGHVSLKTLATQERVLIEVEDECGGLPPGKADELFRRFEQRGRDRTGLGLGLSISRRSVEADGGEIHVRDMPGIGCVFTIDLPRLPPVL
jgi:signal transduction histidine kinase